MMRFMRLVRLFLALFVSVVSPVCASKPILPDGWKLLVVTSAHCPHCENWLTEVHKQWSEQGFSKLVDINSVVVLDAQDDGNLKTLIDMETSGSLTTEVSTVPCFVLLDSEKKRSSLFSNDRLSRCFSV